MVDDALAQGGSTSYEVLDRDITWIFWDSWNIHTDAEDLLHNEGSSANVVVNDTNGLRIGNLLINSGFLGAT